MTNDVSIFLIIILSIIYIILLINRIIYLTKIYWLDISNLKRGKIQKIDSMKARALGNGMMLYTTDMIKGTINVAESAENEKILRRKLKYRHDVINSFITTLTQFFKK